MDSLVERVTSRVALSAGVSLRLEEAAQAVSVLCEANSTLVHGADKELGGVYLTIPIPEKYANRFPDPVVHNKGLEPHLTVLYVQPEMGPGEASKVLHLARAVLRTIAPFRLFVDAQSGLQSWEGKTGEKALWLSARSEPRGEIEKLHRLLRSTLENEGVEIAAHKDFVPHVTWTYAPEDISDEEVRKMDNRISDRFSRGFWFDVKHVMLTLPNGTKRPIALNPMPRSSIY